MIKKPKSRFAALFAIPVLVVVLVAGCGGGGSSSSAGDGSSASPSSSGGTTTSEAPATVPMNTLEPGYADWPFFGRVPQRTHYLPANRG